MGCASHVMDLLYKDLVKGIPLLNRVVQDCVFISNTVKNNMYEKWIDATKNLSPKPPKPRNFPDTRFGYATLVLSTVIKNQGTLEKMISTTEMKSRSMQEISNYYSQVASRGGGVAMPRLVKFVCLIQNHEYNYNFWYLAIAYHGADNFRIDNLWLLFAALRTDFQKWSQRHPMFNVSPEQFLLARWQGQEQKVGLFRPVHLVAHLLNVFNCERNGDKLHFGATRRAYVRQVLERLLPREHLEAAEHEFLQYATMIGHSEPFMIP
eukprot:1321798-Amorphochlora_amoeboformis.AAC.1